MKKVLILGVALLMLVSAAACTGGSRPSGDTEESVAASTPRSSTGIAWKDYVNDYTALVDKIIPLTEKIKKNPLAILSTPEYFAVFAEATALLIDPERLAAVEKELENDPAARAEYEAAMEIQQKRFDDATADIE